MIEVENLAKHFGAVRAVDGVTFCARDGGVSVPAGAGAVSDVRRFQT